MESALRFFYRIFVLFIQWKESYLFEKRKKHYVAEWGNKSYGTPSILRYDDVSKLWVGKYVSIASNVTILLGSNHKLNKITTYPYSGIDSSKSQEETNEKGNVRIGNDVWIGYGATIIGEVTIGDGVIVGAGAVVVNDIPPYAVAVGVPARVAKYRFDEEIREELVKIKWWDFDDEKVKEISKDLYSEDVKSFIDKYKK